MTKLIEVEERYYVTDYLELTKEDYSEYLGEIIKGFMSIHSVKEIGNKVLATTDKSLPLSQITNSITELKDLVNKEVECSFKVMEHEDAIVFSSNADNAFEECQKLLKTYPDMICEVNILEKLVPKESFNKCSDCKYFHTVCDERRRKHSATSNNECFEPKQTVPTNESIEDAAHNYSHKLNTSDIGYKQGYNGFIAGVNWHAKNTNELLQKQNDLIHKMYSEEEVIGLLREFGHHINRKYNPLHPVVGEIGVWFNSNKK